MFNVLAVIFEPEIEILNIRLRFLLTNPEFCYIIKEFSVS